MLEELFLGVEETLLFNGVFAGEVVAVGGKIVEWVGIVSDSSAKDTLGKEKAVGFSGDVSSLVVSIHYLHFVL